LNSVAGATPVAADQPTKPTLCTSANEGRCECANLQPSHTPVAKGSTFIWWIDGTQRCLTTYSGAAGSNSTVAVAVDPLPTVLFLQCYGKDRLQALTPPALQAADRFGLNMVYLSTPTGAWSWNDTVINDTAPRPCSADVAGQDYTYAKDALAFLADQPSFDSKRVYVRLLHYYYFFAFYF
jgi:hypothetical protein